MNYKIYDTDVKKISSALSFMNDSDAALWEEQLLEDTMGKTTFNLGTWDEFQKDLKTTFEPYDASIVLRSGSVWFFFAIFGQKITTTSCLIWKYKKTRLKPQKKTQKKQSESV